MLGDPRTNQHPPLLALGILFYRYHNVVAARVQREHPDMSDEEVFQKARRTVVGTLQVDNSILSLRFLSPRTHAHTQLRAHFYIAKRELERN